MKELYKPEINVDVSIDDDENLRAIRDLHQHRTGIGADREEKQKNRKRVYLHSIGRFRNLKKLQAENSND